jgi:protein-tyrosine phosphatase
MKRHGIDISSQRSRPFVHADFETFDLILVMDQSNLRDVLAMAQGKDEWVDKVHLILDDEEIPDPYYGGASGFAEVFEMLDRASEDWVRSLKG